MSTPRRMSLERARSNACGGAREALPLKEEAWRSSEQTYFGRAYCLPPCPRPAPPLWTPAPPLARDEAPRRGGGGRGPGRGGSGVRRSVHRLVNLCVREAFAAQSAEHSARAGARDAPRGSTRISHAAVRHGAPRSAACAGGGAREHGARANSTARHGKVDPSAKFADPADPAAPRTPCSLDRVTPARGGRLSTRVPPSPAGRRAPQAAAPSRKATPPNARYGARTHGRPSPGGRPRRAGRPPHPASPPSGRDAARSGCTTPAKGRRAHALPLPG